jgi:hypothetical protein
MAGELKTTLKPGSGAGMAVYGKRIIFSLYFSVKEKGCPRGNP